MNRPAGQAKARPQKRPARKPYIERDDGKNLERFNEATAKIISLDPAAVRRVVEESKRPVRKKKPA
jgi:hypothetical protein